LMLIIQVRNMLKLVLTFYRNQINFSFRTYKTQVFMKLNWFKCLRIHEFWWIFRRNEFWQTFWAFVRRKFCSVLPAHLIYKTANGEDRLMSYESLSDGGFATGSMLDQVDLLFTMIPLVL
jgi:hypothetical protein